MKVNQEVILITVMTIHDAINKQTYVAIVIKLLCEVAD